MRYSEFNYARNENGECVLLPGLSPRAPDPNAQCRAGEQWYDLTAYRKIPYSSCEGGRRVDRGTEHTCPGVGGRSAFFWLMMLFIPVSFAGLIGYYFHKKGGYGRGYVSVLLRVLTYTDHLRDVERSDYQGATVDYGTRAALVRSIHLRAYRISSLALLVSPTSGSRRGWTRSPSGYRVAEGTGTCLSTRTRRSCGSRTRSCEVVEGRVDGEGRGIVDCYVVHLALLFIYQYRPCATADSNVLSLLICSWIALDLCIFISTVSLHGLASSQYRPHGRLNLDSLG